MISETAGLVSNCVYCASFAHDEGDPALHQHKACGSIYHYDCAKNVAESDTDNLCIICRKRILMTNITEVDDKTLAAINNNLSQKGIQTFRKSCFPVCCNWTSVALSVSTMIAGGVLTGMKIGLPYHLDLAITGLGLASTLVTGGIATRDTCIRYRNAKGLRSSYSLVGGG